MNAGFGARFLRTALRTFLFTTLLTLLAADFRRTDFLTDFLLPAVFLLEVAIASLPEWVRTVLCLGNQQNYRVQQ